MRRTACGLAAAALASLAVAAPAMADNEITDRCGSGDISLPDLVNSNVSVPWLDLCGADVRGTAGSGVLRGLSVKVRLAGDTANRAQSAAYTFNFATGPCTAYLRYEDVLPSGGRTTLNGQCGGAWQPCQPTIPGSTCHEWVGGTEFARVLPASAGALSGSTVTFAFDPNALSKAGIPTVFLDGFQPGRSLSNIGAITFARSQAGTTADDGVYVLVDQASTDTPLALGGTRKRHR